MPISGLVLTFRGDVSEYPESLRQLTAESAIETGECRGCKLAVVVDTDSPSDDQAIWRWMHELPGVEQVDVAFVGFDDDAPSPPVRSPPVASSSAVGCESDLGKHTLGARLGEQQIQLPPLPRLAQRD